MSSQWVRYLFCLAVVALAALVVAGPAPGPTRSRDDRHPRQRAGRRRAGGAHDAGEAADLRVLRVAWPGWPARCTCWCSRPCGAGQGTFPPESSIEVFSYAVIGGLGSVAGRHVRRVLLPDPRLRPGQAVLRAGRRRSSGYSLSGGRAAVDPLLPARRAVAVRPASPRHAAAPHRRPARHRRAEPRGRPAGRGDRGRPGRGPQRRRDRAHRRGACREPATGHAAPRATGASRSSPCATSTPSYGPVQILFGLDLDIYEGEIVALLGTNGAGKSTLFKCITNLLDRPAADRSPFAGRGAARACPPTRSPRAAS